jgi:hypothetical protein
VINNILSGLDNCIGVGETHWILDKNKNPNQTGMCTECHGRPSSANPVHTLCPVFTPQVLERMCDDKVIERGGWWDIIGESADVEIVISGDKRPHHYERFGVPDKLLLVVKDPRSHIVSWARRKFPPDEKTKVAAYHRGDGDFTLDQEHFDAALNFWIRETRKHITWCINSRKPLAVISLESFVVNSENILREVSDWLNTPFNPKALNYWESDLHYIGSNHSVKRMKPNRYFFKQIKIDERWKNFLSEPQAMTVISDQGVTDQLERLKPYLLGNQKLIHE